MIEFWQECASFLTSQRRTDQIRTIIRKGWFSYVEILEMHQKINNEQNSGIISDTPSNNKKKKQFNRNELLTSENRNAIQTNNTDQTLTQEQKVNLETLMKIMNEEKTTLTSLRNI